MMTGRWRVTALATVALLVATGVLAACDPTAPVAHERGGDGRGDGDDWMTSGRPIVAPPVLSITDLPPLGPEVPTPEAFVAARELATAAGARGAVLTFGWSALEADDGTYTFDALRDAVEWNHGRELFLGIQFINMAGREMPADLAALPLEDPRVAQRLHALLDALAPLLRERVAYLSLGNEIDWYLGIHPEERDALIGLLTGAWTHARHQAPDLRCGTTVTAGATRDARYGDLVAGADVHIVNYYGGADGATLSFIDPGMVYADLGRLLGRLDERPVVFQELGYPTAAALGSSNAAQAQFTTEALRFRADHAARIPFANWFLLYDFPEAFAREQAALLGLDESVEAEFVAFLSSLGLHQVTGEARPAWHVLAGNRSAP